MIHYTYILRILYFVVPSLFFNSCGKKDSTSDPTVYKATTDLYEIDLFEPKFYDTVLRNVEFIPLETSEKCLIANVGKVLSLGDNLYILDNKFNQVYLFNTKGQYRKSIGAIGKGPGEYMSVEDMTFSSDSTSLILLSNNSKKLLHFSLDGLHIKNTSFDIFGAKIVIDSSNTAYIYIDKNESGGSSNFDLLRIDSLGKIKSKYFKFQQRGDFGITFAGFLQKGKKGDVLFNNAFTDTIFSIKEDYVIPKYSFNIPNEKLEINSNKVISNRLTEGKEYNFLGAIFEELPNGIIYSYQSKKMVYTLYENFENRVKFRLSFPLNSIVGKTNANYLLSTISPLVQENDKDAAYYLKAVARYPGLKAALEKVNSEDNPILVKYSLN